MATIVIADLQGKGGFVNKDTVAGGYGARFRGFSMMTRFIEIARRVFQNVPSIHTGYLAAIFANHGHKVIISRGEPVAGDLALVLTSLVDYRSERAWAMRARGQGMRVGFFGTPATHLPSLFADASDFVICGEPEAAAMRLAVGEELCEQITSPTLDLDTLPFPRWDLVKSKALGYSNRRQLGMARAFPMLTSRSCPEHCTYCPHRITASYRARTVENVVTELSELCSRYKLPHVVIRDPLFTYDRDRCLHIVEEIRRRGLKLSFECETRMDDLDDGLIHGLYSAGLRAINFGVESIDPSVLKHVARRHIPHEHLRKMLAVCWELGIETSAFYVFGFLQDTKESIDATIDFACELDSAIANFKVLTPYPGTPHFRQLQPLIFETDWEKFDGYTLNFNHPNITPIQMRKLLGRAFSRFYGRPSRLINWLGLHQYASHPALISADRWALRKQHDCDRSWFQECTVDTEPAEAGEAL